MVSLHGEIVMTYIVVFTGPAGSGKTSLTRAYGDWLRTTLFLNVCQANFDPGAESLPYNPCFDIRRYFTLREIMSRYSLGPNGAFVKAVQIISQKIDEFMAEKPFNSPEDWDVIIIDTPGQLEAFIFQPETRILLNKFYEIGRTVIVYLIDSSLIETAADAITMWFLGILLQIKIGLDVVPVVTKADILSGDKKEIITRLISSPEKLLENISDYEGIISDIVPDLVSIAVKTRGAYRPVLVSINDPHSIEDLHYYIHEVACSCGDLT